jgi:hypothetical protein
MLPGEEALISIKQDLQELETYSAIGASRPNEFSHRSFRTKYFDEQSEIFMLRDP